MLYVTQVGTTILISQTQKPRLSGSKALSKAPLLGKMLRFERQGDWPGRRLMSEAHKDVQEGLGQLSRSLGCEGWLV